MYAAIRLHTHYKNYYLYKKILENSTTEFSLNLVKIKYVFTFKFKMI